MLSSRLLKKKFNIIQIEGADSKYLFYALFCVKLWTYEDEYSILLTTGFTQRITQKQVFNYSWHCSLDNNSNPTIKAPTIRWLVFLYYLNHPNNTVSFVTPFPSTSEERGIARS